MKLAILGTYRDLGLLLMRAGLGISFGLHGYPKLAGGQALWGDLGGAMGALGIGFGHTLWGLAAALTEFVGGIFLILGFYFRPAALLLTVTMLVALNLHLTRGDAFVTYSHALELAFVFGGLLFVGPGRLSVDRN
jgi:putative oxidoreductase